jgi:hypothetical protein
MSATNKEFFIYILVIINAAIVTRIARFIISKCFWTNSFREISVSHIFNIENIRQMVYIINISTKKHNEC